MKNFKELDAMVDSVINISLRKPSFGREIFLFMNVEQKKETDLFLKGISASAITVSCLPETDLKADSFIYRNHTFYIIETGYSE